MNCSSTCDTTVGELGVIEGHSAEPLGFVYRPLADILVAEPLDTILQRVGATIGRPASSPFVVALLLAPSPVLTTRFRKR